MDFCTVSSKFLKKISFDYCYLKLQILMFRNDRRKAASGFIFSTSFCYSHILLHCKRKKN